MTDLKNKSVLVTGGSRGIGAAMARAIGAAGGEVIVHYARNRGAAEAAREDIGAERCLIVQADLAVTDQVDKLWSETLAIAPGLNVLINNAGIFVDAPVDAPLEQWRAAWSRVMQVNLLAPADLCRAAIVHFRDNGGGRIINVASRAAFRGEAPDEMPYGASKGALVTLTKTIARGFAADGVLAFCIAPGFTETEMVTGAMEPEAIARATSDIPLGEMAQPEEIGALAAFLCDDRVRHLTGATFDVNGASYVR
ncbi:MAG: SDR family NAD(P)-dependent oxidoreductase [Alphaproteobacteria bacterium]